ncbi:MAG TPA: FG-GAP-like repeat-containing protein [Gaiellaceae bacterium]|jgi:Na+-translocating ferredoxin:NAD+ oxidoreductase RnfD subunit
MSAPALAAPGGPTISIRGRPYPVLLPKLSDPRLHLATVIISLQVLGQVAFDFRLSISQILIAIGTCAVLEGGIAFFRQHVLMWPASAMLTGNGVAFVLRVPGTEHGDWWSMHGWWIFAGTAAVSLLSKYLITFRGGHIFNPSNFGLVLCFLLIGPEHAEPLDFWWGPMSAWMALALAIIVVGGLAILIRLHLIVIAVAFWLTFAAALAVLMGLGHAFTARWHLGPVSGHYFWWVLVTSPEVLVFLFFMITDPKTTPKTTRGRAIYAVAIGLLSVLLIAPAKTEFWAKVALLGALAIVCAARPLLALLPRVSFDRRVLVALAAVAALAYTGAIAGAGIRARPETTAAPLAGTGRLPQIDVLRSRSVQTKLDRPTASRIAADLVDDLRLQTSALAHRDRRALSRSATFDRLPQLGQAIRSAERMPITVPSYRLDRMRVWLEPGHGQGAAIAVAALEGKQQLTVYTGRDAQLVSRAAPAAFRQTLELQQASGRWLVARIRVPVKPVVALASPAARAAAAKGFAGVRLRDVAAQVGLDFRQGAFRFGVTQDPPAMMGGGVCWLDYDNDGWLDFFVVNSYGEGDIGAYSARGGLPETALFHNDHGRFTDVSASTRAGRVVRGEGCVAGDLNGDGRTDLFVTTAQSDELLWNNGDGTFTEGARAAGIVSFGWHSGATIGDVNGDGRPDLFVAGYTEANGPIPGSSAGYPTNHLGVRDELFLNEGDGPDGRARFREVGRLAGLDPKPFDHSLGATFTDLNGDGRLDLYVANDEDPNRYYVNEPAAGPLGFRFVDRAQGNRIADRNAGMGIAEADFSGDGRQDLFVSNSRAQGHAVYRSHGTAFANAQPQFATAFGTNGTGWGDSWVDLNADGRLDLVVANGAIPITSLAKDAGPVQVLENVAGGFVNVSSLVGKLPQVNGRGVAAADFDNDGHVDLAVSSIGGRLMLLRSTGGSGHWLEVKLPRFAPGALVTATLPDGTKLTREVHAGSSYLSSEDPRLHFGLGPATQVRELTVRYPDGHTSRLRDVAADRIVSALP